MIQLIYVTKFQDGLREDIAMDIEGDKGSVTREKWYLSLSNGNHFIQARGHTERGWFAECDAQLIQRARLFDAWLNTTNALLLLLFECTMLPEILPIHWNMYSTFG